MFKIRLRVAVSSVVIAALGPLGTCASWRGEHGPHGGGGHSHGGSHYHGGGWHEGGHFHGGSDFHGGGSHGGGGFFHGGSRGDRPHMNGGLSHRSFGSSRGDSFSGGSYRGSAPSRGSSWPPMRSRPFSGSGFHRSGSAFRPQQDNRTPSWDSPGRNSSSWAHPNGFGRSSSSFRFDPNRPSYASGNHWNASRSFSSRGSSFDSLSRRSGRLDSNRPPSSRPN
jgi:hypothetical protein